MTIALGASLIILLIGWAGAALGLQYLLGVVLPLAAAVVFVVGFIWRVVYWAKSPVPFAIPTVGGQQKSLDWIKPSRLDAPWTNTAVIGRMALEILTFRSLFRNTNAERGTINGVPRITYYSSKWIWVFALLFHYSMLVILLRHARLFLEPVPLWVGVVEFVDGVMQIGAPRFYMTDALILLALLFLFARRLNSEKLRAISLPADWFALFLLIGIAGSGICMRYMDKVDIAQAKVFIMGLATLRPVSPEGLGHIFFVHLTFVSALLIYFPFSKLMHMGGVFLSPTRTMRINTRQERHINPWNPPKKYHTYAEYEDDFRDAMAEAGLPLEKQPEPKADA
ncbi:MAG: sulfate reduction electron transfer complex DsrMKJOP subunit DsrM [Desulfovibrionaceae bacterium]|nr:sulfate reduction electron transfer complex DsrMKJOP subunit DsrM [Desulfovibrionaceae bacterium]